MSGKKFHRVLVIRGGALGDFLLTLPALQALREASEHLEILAYPQFVQLARAGGVVRSGRSIEYGPLAGFFARGAVQNPALRDYFASFDLVLSYLYDPDEIFAENLRATGVRQLARGPHRPDGRQHAIDQLASPLATIGVALSTRAATLEIPPRAAEAPVIAIHPGSGAAAKNWPVANWLALAQEILSAQSQTRIAIIGGEADCSAIGFLAPLRQNHRVEWWENLPLTELAARLAGAQAYLGHDTGVSHLAAVLDVPLLLLFGPTDPGIWAPPHRGVAVLRAPQDELADLGVRTVLAAARRHFPPRLLATGEDKPENRAP